MAFYIPEIGLQFGVHLVHPGKDSHLDVFMDIHGP